MKTLQITMMAVLTLSATVALGEGDAERGKTFYAVCSTCHGPNGEGMEAMNAPALAGMQEWYVIRQLQNFRSGVRGTNPADIFGMQMAPMAQTLPNAQAIEDVAAYLRSLGE